MTDELPHIALRLPKFCDLLREGLELFLGEIKHAMAWCATSIPYFEDFRQFGQSEAQLQCSLNQSNAIHRVATKHAIAR